MAKVKYKEGSFGAYFVELIKQHNYSQADFAKDIGVSKTYLVDIFHGRVKPPTPEMQEKIVTMLGLEENEKIDFFSKAAIGRSELPKDIVDFGQKKVPSRFMRKIVCRLRLNGVSRQ